MYHFNISDNCAKAIIISSTGGAAKWKTRLGKYNFIRYDDNSYPIYEHELKNGTFLYKAMASYGQCWMVSNSYI